MHEGLGRLFEQRFGVSPASVTPLPAHGSNRRLFRLTGADGVSVIGVENDDEPENRAFLEFSRHFRSCGLPVPNIHAADTNAGIYLEEDLGDTTLFDLLNARRPADGPIPDDVASVYDRAIRILPRFQFEAARGLNYEVCYPRHSFDRQSMLWDLNYFKYYFLKLARIPFNEQRLENDFDTLTSFLLEAGTDGFLYRDFQSRNIMVRDDGPWFIDYQGGRRGAPQYDVASLLYDAKAKLPDAFRERLLSSYLEAAAQTGKVEQKAFLRYYPGFVLIRMIQAMGAYGFRGFFERKAHFLQSVPHAVQNLETLLATNRIPEGIPALREALERIVESPRLREIARIQEPLTVKVMSFSYKFGLPADEVGHGGGYVFDCRALPNPGREERFVAMTGSDPEVIAYLEREEDVHSFLASVRALVSQSVDNYQRRNFSSLSVAFGCTGGRHRSVYCANMVARFLRSRPNVVVELSHREMDKLAGGKT